MPRWGWLALGISIPISVLFLLFIIAMVFTEDTDSQNNSETNGIPALVLDTTIEALPTLTHTLSPSATPTVTASATVASPTATATPTPIKPATVTDTASTPEPTVVAAAQSPSLLATPACTPPAGWQAYTVQQGDTLFAFQLGAGRAGTPTSVDEIIAANCLGSRFLQVDQVLYLPEGAAENAPSSEPAAPALPAGVPRSANCPCQLTIQPGWRLEQIADAINRTAVSFSGADFLAVAGPGASLPTRDFLAEVPSGAGLEGFMFPGSYTLQNETTAATFRDMVLDAFAANAAPTLSNATAQGVTLYQALILASIVQKEAGSASEQRLVASVFYNRLATGRALGATVTIQYALGGPGSWWPRLQSGQTNINSPYNTYRFRGFTPTPISSPALSAIQAVAAPAQTDYIYFTGNCRGPGNAYAATYEQHLANVNCE